jgi:hypothetical protein
MPQSLSQADKKSLKLNSIGAGVHRYLTAYIYRYT